MPDLELDSIKIEIFAKINDEPKEPTETEAGNGSHLIAQFNKLINYLANNLDSYATTSQLTSLANSVEVLRSNISSNNNEAIENLQNLISDIQLSIPVDNSAAITDIQLQLNAFNVALTTLNDQVTTLIANSSNPSNGSTAVNLVQPFAHWKADTLTGSAIQNWNDSTPNGYNLVAQGNSFPVLIQNGKNALSTLRFTGSQILSTLNIGTAFNLFTYTILAVAKPSGSNGGLCGKNTTNTNGAGRRKLQLNLSSTSFDVSNGADSNGIAYSIPQPSNTWHIYGHTANDNLDNELTVDTVTERNTTSALDLTGTNGNQFNIGCPFDNRAGEFFSGDIAEVIIFDYALTSSQRSAWIASLNSKWAIY